MKTTFLILILLCCMVIGCYSQKDAAISNVDFSITGSKLVITYQINHFNEKDRFNIRAEIYKASGEKINASTFSGDLRYLPGGPDKKIVWDIEKDNIILEDDIYVQISGELITEGVSKPETAIIIFLNGEESEVEIVDVGTEVILYREIGKTLNYFIPCDKVKRIQYPDGKIIEFNGSQTKKKTAVPGDEPPVISDSQVKEKYVTEDETVNNRMVGFDLDGKIGYFVPFNDAIREIFGGGFTYMFSAGYWFRDGYGWDLEFSNFEKEGGTYSGVTYSRIKITLTSATTSINYAFIEKGIFRTYGGYALGVSRFLLIEGSEEFSKILFKHYVYGGICVKPFKFEIRAIDIYWKEKNIGKTNLGGIEICGGLFF